MSNKRLSCDHDELNFEPQFKKHVIETEVEYVFNKQSVYDKTLEMLFKAAKLSPSNQKTSTKTVIFTKVDSENMEPKSVMKQLLLDNNCKLEKKRNSLPEYVHLPNDLKCSFCERLSCFTQLIQCKNCEECFCDNCSFHLFVSSEEIFLCKSCFK